MNQVVVDRSILKAFYTQYVAVLLIMLVFTIAARAPKQKHSQYSETKDMPEAAALMGTMMLHNPEMLEGDLPFKESAELDAVGEILRNHDLRALFRISLKQQEGHNAEARFRGALSRVEEIKRYLLNQNVDPLAVRIAVEDGVSQEAKILVDFESVEVPHASQ
jgi:hypothetical protein